MHPYLRHKTRVVKFRKQVGFQMVSAGKKLVGDREIGLFGPFALRRGEKNVSLVKP